MTKHNWSAAQIGAYLVRYTFQRKALLVVPECYWAGEEADLLVVTQCMRLIDVELKVSRQDLRADAGKGKWWTRAPGSWSRLPGETWEEWDARTKLARDWPPKIWKHYYCMPAEIWKPELIECLPSPRSGVLLVKRLDDGRTVMSVVRMAVPNRDAKTIEARHAIDIARLAGLRMWDALIDAERVLKGAA